jgi:hypothetical protein
MNTTNLQRIRDLIASQPPEALKMDAWFTGADYDLKWNDEDQLVSIVIPEIEHTCGTAACIGGWAMVQLSHDLGTQDIPSPDGFSTEARNFLGLTPTQAGELFYPSNITARTQADALATLDHLIATGEVKWS